MVWQGTPEDPAKAVNQGSDNPSIDPDEEVCFGSSGS